MKPGWRALLCSATGAICFCCNDETTEVVGKSVCYSELRWVGGKRGSPEMYPGRDCVGCHIENDGPPLAIGGTIYPYVIDRPEIFELQTGQDCFGVEGVRVRVTDASGLLLEVTTNRAGNFFVEGNPNELAKPLEVEIEMGAINPQMPTHPMYGGCAGCHDPSVPRASDVGLPYETSPTDAEYRNGTARIGLGGYRPHGPDTPTVEQELRALAGAEGAGTQEAP